MNTTIKKAMEMDKFNNQLPVLEIGDIVTLGEVWDGEGEIPKYFYVYDITDEFNEDYITSINYEFDILIKKKNPLDTIVKITSIDLI